MGCINSKKELIDINPNLYRVVNVDDEGNALWSGQLGITRLELTLYRKGKDPTTWPIKCLRRYGYDADLFTFEAGRRCTTGEGIYAFRCRRAESLFQTLQSYIQLPIEDTQNQDLQMLVNNGPLVIPRHSGSSQQPSQTNQTPSGGYYIMNRPTSQNLSPSGTIQSNSNRTRSADTLTSDGNYLDPTPNRPAPISRFQSGLRLSSVSSGPMSPDPGSPSSITDILEVTQLNPLPTSNPGNLYQEFPLREHNNNSSNKKLSLDCPINLDCPPQEPAPAPSLSALRREFGVKNSMDNELPVSLSPISTTQAASDLLDNSHIMYMNIVVGESQQNKFTSGSDTPKVIQTPTTTGSMFGIPHSMHSQYSIDSMRLYENLEPGDIRPLAQRNRLSKPDIFAKVELPANEKSEPSTPNHRCVYIQLDLDQISSTVSNSANISTSSSGTNSRPILPTITTTSVITNNTSSISTTTMSVLPPDSPKSSGVETNSGLDYATIDFNKTIALSNSTTPSSELDGEGSRKTRHSSIATFGPTKHSNSVSD
ncbi:fibroblast growth factor receptor substrate 2 [Bradysia coprophila]|uniref:fibroblast growth factor receptor substrate 2 n=1 Tax=Bradysia coprophila TaxID=38358 RepID=UPI00187DCF49|nr:fibroblast growth factor receptor substrate 2 [Bradysia coprophila]